MSLPPGARLGSYEVAELIGQGGMGEVYRARDTKLGRDVALKVLPEAFAADPERFARFQREARVLAALNHPHIATLHGFEETAGRFAIVMELVDGPTLANRIADGPLPLDEALAIARQVAAALEAAHDQGVVHRDLKPANVKVKDDGTVKVLDFGLAKAMDAVGTSGDAADSPTITSPAMTLQGVILGTAAYMSPEQARGKRVDRRADIWAFGCLLYEMVTGLRLFRGDDVTETIASVVKVEPDLSLAPREVRRLLKRCLEKDPRKRLRDIGDAWDLLDRALDDSASASAPAARISPLLVIGLLLAGAAVGAAAIWWARQPGGAPAVVVTRFAETISDGVSLNVHVTVSPDGRAVVYRMQGLGQAWLQRRYLDQLGGGPIGDAMGSNPSFSPDGRWVAYRVGRLLKRVSVDGGPSETIATLPFDVLVGATWMDDGSMVIGFAREGLLRVAPAGGALTVMAKPEVGASLTWPHALPGGRSILYSQTEAGGAVGEMSILDIGTGQSKPLLRGSNGRYLSSGHLVFHSDGSLWAVAFDLDRLEVRGTPRAVVEGVRSAASFGISQNGTLAYLPDAPAQPRSLVWVDRRGRETALPLETRAWANPRVSPDGKLIAMPMRAEGNDVWIWDLAGRSLRQLTSDPLPNFLAAWAPDSKRLAFSRVAGGRTQLFWQAADGSGTPTPLSTQSDQLGEYPYGFASDGALLYSLGTIDIGVLTPDGATRRMLANTAAVERNAAVSPDGRWFAFESNRTGRNEIYVRPYPNAQDGEWKVTRDGGITPVWSRDGKELYYWKNTGPEISVNAISITPGATFHPGESRELFTGQYAQTSWDTGYDVAPDGRFLMMKPVGIPPRDQIIIVQNWIEELKRLVPVK